MRKKMIKNLTISGKSVIIDNESVKYTLCSCKSITPFRGIETSNNVIEDITDYPLARALLPFEGLKRLHSINDPGRGLILQEHYSLSRD